MRLSIFKLHKFVCISPSLSVQIPPCTTKTEYKFWKEFLKEKNEVGCEAIGKWSLKRHILREVLLQKLHLHMSYAQFQTQVLLWIQWILLHKLLFTQSFPWQCFESKKQTCAGENVPRIKQHISASLFGNTMSAGPPSSSPGSCAEPIAAAVLSEHTSLGERTSSWAQPNDCFCTAESRQEQRIHLLQTPNGTKLAKIPCPLFTS